MKNSAESGLSFLNSIPPSLITLAMARQARELRKNKNNPDDPACRAEACKRRLVDPVRN